MNENVDGQLRCGGLPVLSTGANLAELDLHGGPDFWNEVQRFARGSQLEPQVDVAIGGRAAPRVWAFLESPGNGAAAAAAALGTAWLLADRGQTVVLVDADEQEPRITRWLGRVEQEGWIDMVRFGASLQAASVPLPSAGRRGSVLGVGTFAPTGITPEEVGELVGRLRRQADDLVLVLPAKLRSGSWLEAANITLLCWDLLARSAGDTEKILVELERMGAKATALLGFGVEEYLVIQERLCEGAATAAPPREEIVARDLPEAPPELPSAAPVPSGPEPQTPSEPPHAEVVFAPAQTEADVEAETTDGAAPDRSPLASDLAEAAVAAGDPLVRPHPRTSRVFVVAGVLAVVVLAFLGLFLRDQLQRDRAAEELAAVEALPVVPGEPEFVAAEPAPPEGPAVVQTSSEPAAADAIATTPAPETDAAAAETDAAAAETDAAGMDWSPYRKPAGEDGWTLWLFSLPGEPAAASEVGRLDRLGIRAASRAVELPEKGRVWRVYAGSFATRAAAQAAAPALLHELKHNWAVPARF